MKVIVRRIDVLLQASCDQKLASRRNLSHAESTPPTHHAFSKWQLPAAILRHAYCVMWMASGVLLLASFAMCMTKLLEATLLLQMSLRIANAANMLNHVGKMQNDTLTAAQCRMARAGLGLSITEASKASLVSRATITRFESGIEIKPVLRSALRAAFERLGAVITDSGVEITEKRGGEGA